MTVVAVELEGETLRDLEKTSGQYNLPSNQMIRRIVENYLHIEKVNRLRRELSGTAETAGFSSEEDIYIGKFPDLRTCVSKLV